MTWRRRSRSAAGRSSGLDIGLRSNGQRLVLPYPRLPHILIAGLTGSGKSSIINALMYALSGLSNVAIIGSDLKRVELWPWSPRMTCLAVEGPQVDGMLIRLRSEIEWREQLLQSLGLREWQPELGPWLVFLVDEFAELTVADLNRLIEATQAEQTTAADNAVHAMMRRARSSLGIRSGILESFARKCRALGVTIIIATQYPTADVVDTQVRSQFSLRFMCRVSSKEQVKVCLGNGMEEQVDVRDLSPDQPGSFVVAGLETNVFTARAAWIDDDLVRARAAATAHLRIDPEALFDHGDTQPESSPQPTPGVEEPVVVVDEGTVWL